MFNKIYNKCKGVNDMYQQQSYNYYQQQQPQMNYVQQPVGLKGRPVSSFEEARAANIDFDGSIAYFPDVANKKIYTKQINMDGTATLLMYELKEIPKEQPNYITREEFDRVIAALQQSASQQKKIEF